MNKFINYISSKNSYSLFFKTIGFGFQLIGLSLFFKNNYPVIYIIAGMTTGLIYIAIGEIINLLDKISKKGK
jgi:hypothetical protein